MEENNTIYNLIVLENNGKLNPVQKEELQSWLGASPENISEYNKISGLLDYSGRLAAMKKIDAAKDLEAVKRKLSRKQPGRFLVYFQRIAAILLLPLLVYSGLNISGISKKHEKGALMKSSETSFGVRTQIELSDGSKVWLNSGSKLIYPDEFSGNSREVHLVGEAFFQVKSDTEHPFFVDLGGYKVKATGTRFNISNYPEDKDILAYLQKGRISLSAFYNGTEGKPIPLDEKEVLILNKEKKQYDILKEEGNKYMAWLDGLLVFKNDNTYDVAVRLGRWYNAEVIFDEDLLQKGYVFTATFKEESLEEALKLLSYSSPIKYTIISGSQRDDSSFSKRKVIITKK